MGYYKRARTDYIVWHCSATRPNHDVTAKEIDGWHKRQGWPGIAYAWFIRRDGTLEKGADEDACAYHAGGHWNNISLGICYAGGVNQQNWTQPEDNLNAAQEATLIAKTRELLAKYPGAKVIGHNAVAQKACPSFDWIAKCKKYDLPYADLRKPKRSAIATLVSGTGAAAANELPSSPTRTGLLDGIDPQTALAPVTNILTEAVGPGASGLIPTVAKFGLAAIAIVTAAFAIYRVVSTFRKWQEARNAPPTDEFSA